MVETLKAQKPLVQAYVMDEIFDKLESGEAAIGVSQQDRRAAAQFGHRPMHLAQRRDLRVRTPPGAGLCGTLARWRHG